MRVGLDLRTVADPGALTDLACEADRLGIWAVLVGGEPGTEINRAAALAAHTEHVHLAVWLDASTAHPLTLAEELSILDHLSERRMFAVIDGPADVVDDVRRLLHGHIVDGVALAPPPAQTEPPVRSGGDIVVASLTGDLDVDRPAIDDHRDAGVASLFATWPGSLPVLARHLVTRAAGPDFPQIVADVADQIAPLRPSDR